MTVETPPAPAPVETNNSEIHLTETETENSMKSIRFLLLTITASFINLTAKTYNLSFLLMILELTLVTAHFTYLFTVLSLMMVILGTLVYSNYHSFSFFYDGKISGLLTPSAMSVFIALAMLIVSIFGYLGSMKLSTCMINTYACILMTMFIIKLVVVILAFTLDSGRIMHYIDIPVWGYNDFEIQQEVDALQANFACCGSNSFMDYLDFRFINHQPVVQVNVTADYEMVTMTVPKSCCVFYTGGVCDMISGIGCKEALGNALVQNSIVIGVLGVSDMIINLLGIIVALLLARCIRKTKSARAVITWKIQENMIMQREAEEMQKNAGLVFIVHKASNEA